MASDLATLRQWLGKTQQETDQVTLTPCRAMAALLDRDPSSIEPGAPLPPLWHWLYFLAPARQSLLSTDGHPQRGEFLPPVDLPRRMWAGSRLHFRHPLSIGDSVSRTSTIRSIDRKKGRSGDLVFVCVAHEISNADGVSVVEEHDIVYRDIAPSKRVGGRSPDGPAEPETRDFCRVVDTDILLLFRYSALTFNAHRIHYDRPYATETEGYPGLVVHGPLLATLMLDVLGEALPERTIAAFEFRAVHPVFEGRAIRVCGRNQDQDTCELWVADHENRLCMRGVAQLESLRE